MGKNPSMEDLPGSSLLTTVVHKTLSVKISQRGVRNAASMTALESAEWFDFKSRLSLIVRVNVVLNRTVVVDSDWRFDNLRLRADEIKHWLTPSAKQRRNPCSGLPAVYPDLSTRHDWPVKKGLCFVCRDRQSGWREIRNALPVTRWVRWGSRTRISALLRRRY